MAQNLIGTFDTADMLEAINATPRPKTFLRVRLFGGRKREFTTEHVTADFMKGKRHLAPFVSRYRAGRLQEKLSFDRSVYTPPRIAPMQAFNGSEAFKLPAGKLVGAPNDPADNMAQFMAREMAQQDDGITRREEWMLAKMLTTGVIPIVGEGVVDEIDLNHDLTETLSGDDQWDSVESNPLNDIRRFKKAVAKSTGLTPDTAILGEDVANALLDHEGLRVKLDTWNATYGALTSQDLPNGVEYLGRLSGVDLFTYDEWYVDDTTGLETPMIPDNQLIMFPSAERNPGAQMLYGAYYDIEDGTTYVGERIPRQWTEKGPNQLFVQVQAYPIPFIPDVDSWIRVTVL